MFNTRVVFIVIKVIMYFYKRYYKTNEDFYCYINQLLMNQI